MKFGSCLVAALLLSGPILAEELLPATKSIPQTIDHYVTKRLVEDEITPAEQADDATLIRRLTLDLVGRIPTLGESEAYVQSQDPNKREKLIDRLIASPAFARFQGIQFDAMLSLTDGGRGASIKDYLQGAIKDGKSWDQIFRELLLPDSDDPMQKGATEYLRSRVNDLDRLTNDVSVAFFGVNVSCAQCHDHPLVEDWKQDHFYGMKSFFSRTYDANGFLGEREAGLVKFKPTKGPEREAKLMFLTGTTVDTNTLRDLTKEEQKSEKEAQEKAKNAKTKAPPPAPKFSARTQLVEVALRPGAESEFFAKALVNRLWHRFLGYGLVNPLDQLHSENPPSHPELLSWLARDTVAHKYDLRRLIKGLVQSQTYSRGSQYSSASQPLPSYFAVGRLKAMTPTQMGTSLKLAVADPATLDNLKPEEFEKRIEQFENAGRGIGNSLVQPSDDFQIGVGEALMFSNSDRVMKDLLNDGGGSLLAKLNKLDDPNETIELLVKTVYNRPPTAAEKAALGEYLSRRTDRKPEAFKQVLWALLTSAEFRFCY